ncbi:sensor histidine kinase [Kitasatospora sp. NPDC059646]|uniref:sensor histidine kinase n=1 Tax=Kitasatospora sp. NPDC059646 TaxID=3346893 RepID=UPI00369F99C1
MTGAERPAGLHLWAVDAVVAAVTTAAYWGLAVGPADDGQPGFTGPAWLAVLLALGVGGPLAVRRRWPLPVLAVVLAATAAATLLDVTRDPFLAAALAGYPVAVRESARRAAGALAAAVAVASAAVLLGEGVVTPSGSIAEAAGTAAATAGVLGAAWAAGRAVRAGRERAAVRARSLERAALVEERLRIARELHDIVSHSLSVIVVRAAVADHVAEVRPAELRAAVREIERTGREALTEMRRALGVLREEGAADAPAPGLDGLPLLVRRARDAGLRVSSAVQPGLAPPAGVALAVHRIVQEALTNVLRHAGPGTRCELTVRREPGGIRVEVADDGAGRPAARRVPGGGHGLAGMRERAMMYGGTLAAGPRPDGGFTVSAHLPVERAAGRAADAATDGAGDGT